MQRVTKKSKVEKASSILEQSMGNISHDLLYYIITGFGLSIMDIQNLCSVNQRFRKICKDKNVWKQVFVKKFNPTNDQSLNDLWDSVECEGFIKILAFAFKKDLMENESFYHSILFVNKRENVGFDFSREHRKFRGQTTFFPGVVLLEQNKNKNYWERKELDEQAKELEDVDYFPWRFSELATRYKLTYTGNEEGVPKFKLQSDLVVLICRLINDGYKFKRRHGLQPQPAILTEACITCGATRDLLQCSGSCVQIYCSAECQIMNHQRDCK